MPRVTITITDEVPQPYRFDLFREVVTIGRAGDNDIIVSSGSVSGKHAEMHRISGGYELVDLGSTNGMKVDGVRQMRVSLISGMVVKLGDVEFGFTLSDEELASLAAEATSGFASDSFNKTSAADSLEHQNDFPTLPPIDESRVRTGARKPKEQTPLDEEDEEDDDDSPEPIFKSPKAKWSTSFVLFVIVAAAIAFFFGADKRHQDDTSEGLLKGMLNKSEFRKKASEATESSENE